MLRDKRFENSRDCMEEALNLVERKVPVAIYFGVPYVIKVNGYELSTSISNRDIADSYLKTIRYFPNDAIVVMPGITESMRNKLDKRISRDSEGNLTYLFGDRSLGEALEDKIIYADTLIKEGSVDVLQEVVKNIKEEIFVGATAFAPLYKCADQIGMENLFLALHTEKDKFRKFMSKVVDAEMEKVRACVKTGADFITFIEIYGGVDSISPKMYSELVFPYEKELIDRTKDLSPRTYSFIYFCGNSLPVLEKIVNTGADCVWLEMGLGNYRIDLKEAKKYTQGKTCLMGNIDTRILEAGTSEDVRKEVQNALRSASNGGYILSTGSELSPRTPPENIDAFLLAAREYNEKW